MSAQERPTRNNGPTDGTRNEPQADVRQDQDRQARGIRISIILALMTFVTVIIAGFVIALVAGRVPADRGRDVPTVMVQSPLMGQYGNSLNKQEPSG